MVDWKYNGKKILSHSDLPDNTTHIVYELTYADGMKYLGYKTVRSERRLKPTKTQLAIRKNYKRVEFKDLPFVNYNGSSKANDGREVVSKEILHITSNKRTANYLEVKLIMMNSAIENNDKFTNLNCNGKWYDNCLDGLIGVEDEK